MLFLNEWVGYNLEFWQWAVFCFYAISVGLTKTGIFGSTLFMIPLMAIAFGARESTGIALPMLCFADLLAILYYRRSVDLKCVMRLLPWALLGIIVALFVDHLVPIRAFRFLIGISVLGSVIVMLWNEIQAIRAKSNAVKGENDKSISERDIPFLRVFKQAVFGVAGGFSTMIGNTAGPIMSVYLLSMRLPKLNFVGTTASFFLIVNYLKLPVQIFVWDNITFNSLKLGSTMIPFIGVGAALGIILVRRIPEKLYRYLILILTTISAIILFL